MTFDTRALDWLSQATGIHPLEIAATRLKGSTSSSIYRIESAARADIPACVLRVLDNREWLASEPDLINHEACALMETYGAELRAPRLIAYTNDEVGFGAPALLMSCVEGKIELCPTDLTDWLRSLAVELADIHRHCAPAFPWRFKSWVNRVSLAPPHWSANPSVWERAIDRLLRPAPNGPTVFIHRDYHPTNVLFDGTGITGVVDWINACQGPAGVDLAHCKTNLVMMMGQEVAERFHALYLEADRDFVYDPYWDVDSVLDMCFPEPTFYEPWVDFGLQRIEAPLLQRRIDRYLESLTRQL